VNSAGDEKRKTVHQKDEDGYYQKKMKMGHWKNFAEAYLAA